MKKVSGIVRAAGLLALLLLFIAEAVGQTSHAIPGAGARLVSIPWHFSSERLSVPDSLPVGTVIAAAVLPSEYELFARDRDVSGGLWGTRGPAASWLAARTALEGVMVRIVPEVSRSGEWWQGELRIELVKTGVIKAGVLHVMKGLPEYRLWRNRPGGRQVLLRERLVMDKPLTVAVVTDSPADEPVTAGGEEG